MPRPWIASAVVLLAAGSSACNRRASGSLACSHTNSTPAISSVQAGASPALEPWEPADEAFRGCERACGKRVTSSAEGVVVQPGARPGQRAYCPVSGVVFEVKDSSPRRDVQGRPVYLCCDACARFFDANREHVVALRGLVASR